MFIVFILDFLNNSSIFEKMNENVHNVVLFQFHPSIQNSMKKNQHSMKPATVLTELQRM